MTRPPQCARRPARRRTHHGTSLQPALQQQHHRALPTAAPRRTSDSLHRFVHSCDGGRTSHSPIALHGRQRASPRPEAMSAHSLDFHPKDPHHASPHPLVLINDQAVPQTHEGQHSAYFGHCKQRREDAHTLSVARSRARAPSSRLSSDTDRGTCEVYLWAPSTASQAPAPAPAHALALILGEAVLRPM